MSFRHRIQAESLEQAFIGQRGGGQSRIATSSGRPVADHACGPNIRRGSPPVSSPPRVWVRPVSAGIVGEEAEFQVREQAVGLDRRNVLPEKTPGDHGVDGDLPFQPAGLVRRQVFRPAIGLQHPEPASASAAHTGRRPPAPRGPPEGRSAGSIPPVTPRSAGPSRGDAAQSRPRVRHRSSWQAPAAWSTASAMRAPRSAGGGAAEPLRAPRGLRPGRQAGNVDLHGAAAGRRAQTGKQLRAPAGQDSVVSGPHQNRQMAMLPVKEFEEVRFPVHHAHELHPGRPGREVRNVVETVEPALRHAPGSLGILGRPGLRPGAGRSVEGETRHPQRQAVAADDIAGVQVKARGFRGRLVRADDAEPIADGSRNSGPSRPEGTTPPADRGLRNLMSGNCREALSHRAVPI